MPPRRKLVAVSDKPAREAPPDLRDMVREALANMPWLGPSDEALKALALRQADEIEKAVDRAEELAALQREAAGDIGIHKRLEKLAAMCDVTKTVGWLGPQLQGVLRDLGGTPGARRKLQEAKAVGGRLAQLREGVAAVGQHDPQTVDPAAG